MLKKIVIATHYPLVFSGMKEMLESRRLGTVQAMCPNFEALRTLLRAQSCDLLLFDLQLPDKGPLETIRELRESYKTLPILATSIEDDRMLAVRAIRMGASGYLSRNITPERLELAVQKVGSGGTYVGPHLAEYMTEVYIRKDGQPLHTVLSDREFEVLRYLATGLSISEISDELALSVKTVSTYRGRLLQKMGMRNNAQLIQYALRENLVDGAVG